MDWIRINRRWLWGCWLLANSLVSAGDGLPDPLGYPQSLDEPAESIPSERTSERQPAVSRASEQRRVDEPQLPGGLDAWRFPGLSPKPEGLLVSHQEPAPAAPCDCDFNDAAWMGPGELAYRVARHRCGCSRDHTRAFRSEFLGRLWVDAEYLLWATSAQELPAIVTSSPLGTPGDEIGVMTAPTTAVLLGSDNFTGPMRSGGRITGGYWFDPAQHRGVEAAWFGLATATGGMAQASSGGDPWLARPYVDASTGQAAAVVVPLPGPLPADPTLLSQAISGQFTTTLSGVEVLYRHAIAADRFHRRYLTAGWRYFMLQDAFIVEQSAAVSTGTPGGLPLEQVTARDVFDTLSQFNGAEVGIVERWWRGRASLEIVGKVALGASGIRTSISGDTTASETTAGGSTSQSYPGGLLALPTNQGFHRDTLVAGAGEVGVAADYAIWSQCRLSLGYSFLWLTTVGRAAAQIDTTINPSQFAGGSLTGVAAPAFHLRTDGFWAQGLSLGLEYQF